MENQTPQVINIGEHLGRIIRIDANQVEYLDEAGISHTLDLAGCCRSAESRMVGMRGLLDEHPWVEFFGSESVRFTFNSTAQLVRDLLVPLGKAGWRTLDGN